MDRLDVSEDRIKASIFWLGEKVGRLKPNGELLQFSRSAASSSSRG